MKKIIPVITAVLLILCAAFAAPVLAQDVRGAELRLVVGEELIPPKTPEEISDAIKDLPYADDYDSLTDQEKAQVMDQVDNIVLGIENLSEEEQGKIPQKDIEKLGDLYDKIYNVTIHKDTSAVQGLSTRVPEEDIWVHGAGMAAAALGGDVKIIIRQDMPPEGAVMAFTFELYLKRDGEQEYTKVQLRTPLLVKMKLPASVKAEGLIIRHVREDGSMVLMATEMDGRTASFMPTHFSNFLFIEANGSDPAPDDTISEAPPLDATTSDVTPSDDTPSPKTGDTLTSLQCTILVALATVFIGLGAGKAKKKKRT